MNSELESSSELGIRIQTKYLNTSRLFQLQTKEINVDLLSIINIDRRFLDKI